MTDQQTEKQTEQSKTKKVQVNTYLPITVREQLTKIAGQRMINGQISRACAATIAAELIIQGLNGLKETEQLTLEDNTDDTKHTASNRRRKE